MLELFASMSKVTPEVTNAADTNIIIAGKKERDLILSSGAQFIFHFFSLCHTFLLSRCDGKSGAVLTSLNECAIFRCA